MFDHAIKLSNKFKYAQIYSEIFKHTIVYFTYMFKQRAETCSPVSADTLNFIIIILLLLLFYYCYYYVIIQANINVMYIEIYRSSTLKCNLVNKFIDK